MSPATARFPRDRQGPLPPSPTLPGGAVLLGQARPHRRPLTQGDCACFPRVIWPLGRWRLAVRWERGHLQANSLVSCVHGSCDCPGRVPQPTRLCTPWSHTLGSQDARESRWHRDQGRRSHTLGSQDAGPEQAPAVVTTDHQGAPGAEVSWAPAWALETWDPGRKA